MPGVRNRKQERLAVFRLYALDISATPDIIDE